MSLAYDDEQRLLADTARDFLAERSPVVAQRALRDRRDPLGFEPALWQEMVELGWSAVPFGEVHGGLDFGYQGLGVICEAMGRQLSPAPLLSSVVLCGSLLEGLDDPARAADLLPPLIAGEWRPALALEEGRHHQVLPRTCRARGTPEGFRLDGEKSWVVDGMGADAYLVTALMEEGDPALFLVPAESAGLSVEGLTLVDSRNGARLRLEQVLLGREQLLARGERCGALLETALDRARACLAAELLGASEALFEMTLEYLKTRRQFDVPIGSFQALQHRCAWLHVELALARSTVMAALEAVDQESAERARLVSLAKWKMGAVAERVSREAVQLHGGIGVTDELDVGLYLKRIRVAQACLGDGDYHLDRYASTVAAEV
ncbi:acyl-CoA dehydrogenase family protein [Halomonas sp. E14]|uniref:acyl-CoA dehydrogenase family protein n=1 Tax=Halomonas sp. E14 TaxID=3397245 RepID=UPI00403ED9E8